MKIENLNNINMLIQTYGCLLNARQLEALKYYYELDYSLNEIAEQMAVTRQGARNYITTAQCKLQDYEDKLKLIKKYQCIKEEVISTQCITSDDYNKRLQHIINFLEE